MVLPEAMMVGFGTPTTELSPFAEPLAGPFVSALAEVAAASDVTVIAGMFEPASAARV